jgi:predicted transcriptional regulator
MNKHIGSTLEALLHETGERGKVEALIRKKARALRRRAAKVALSEQGRFVEALRAGLADAEAGRVHPHADVTRRMKARFGRKAT